MSYTALSKTTPKARKEHACTYCGEKVKVGETYYREEGVYDGNMQSLPYHTECDAQDRLDHLGEHQWEIEIDEFSPRPQPTSK
jgi:hypothetical protein